MGEIQCVLQYSIVHGWVQFRDMDRNDPWPPKIGHLPLGRSYLVVVPSYDMSCALILLIEVYG